MNIGRFEHVAFRLKPTIRGLFVLQSNCIIIVFAHSFVHSDEWRFTQQPFGFLVFSDSTSVPKHGFNLYICGVYSMYMSIFSICIIRVLGQFGGSSR